MGSRARVKRTPIFVMKKKKPTQKILNSITVTVLAPL